MASLSWSLTCQVAMVSRGKTMHLVASQQATLNGEFRLTTPYRKTVFTDTIWHQSSVKKNVACKYCFNPFSSLIDHGQMSRKD